MIDKKNAKVTMSLEDYEELQNEIKKFQEIFNKKYYNIDDNNKDDVVFTFNAQSFIQDNWMTFTQECHDKKGESFEYCEKSSFIIVDD